MSIARFAASIIVAAGIAAPAVAAPIAPSGTTDVTVSDDVLAFLSGASIVPSAIAPATVSGATFAFPITGGETDTLTITHNGGVRLEGGGAFIEVSDFVIEGALGVVNGTVFGSDPAFATPVFADLFMLDAVDLGPPITANLKITGTLNGALGTTFAGGADLGLTGAVFGSAETAPQVAPIPLPAAAPMLLAGIAGLALFRRRATA